MAAKTIKRPPREPDAIIAWTREMFAIFKDLGIAEGDPFIVSNGKDAKSRRELDEHDADELGPFSRDSKTSRAAALANYPRSGSQRHRVLVAIVEYSGLTRDEVSNKLSLPDSSVDARVLELKKGGWVEESEDTRTTRNGSQAAVVRATAKGRDAVVNHLGYREDTLV